MTKRAGRLARGRPRSQGSDQKPDGGQFFVVLSKTSWVRDYRAAFPIVVVQLVPIALPMAFPERSSRYCRA